MFVDGYNIIGAWPELRKLKKESLELARDRLLEILREFQVVSGMQITIVFDAYQMAGARSFEYRGPLQVVFTKENETADEWIERFVYEALRDRAARVWVATNDHLEQQVTFGEGAYRIPARELWQKIEDAKKSARKEMQRLGERRERNFLSDHLDPEVAKQLEKWRRNS